MRRQPIMNDTTVSTQQAMPRPRSRRAWGAWMLYGLLIVSTVGVVAFVTLRPIQVMPRLRLAPGFWLTDQNGTRLTNEDLKGQLVLYTVAYSRCQPPCPQTSDIMRAVQTRLATLETYGLPVTLITLSLDPVHDTPEVLQAYAAAVGADPQLWRFAVGAPDRLKAIVGRGFEIYYTTTPEGQITFEPAFILVDGWGIIRAEYRYRALTSYVDDIIRHIGVVAEEAHRSKGTARLAYEAAHFFLCYAR